MEYLTAKEVAEKWGVSQRWVHKLCEDGRVEGTRRFGRNWMIPAGAEKPADLRVKDGKCRKQRPAKGQEADGPAL